MKTNNLIDSQAFIKNDTLFFDSLIECAKQHYECSDYFRFVMDRSSFDLNNAGLKDLEYFPYINVELFKRVNFYNKNYAPYELHLTSSGTGGQKSQNYLDADSLKRVKTSAFNIYNELGVVSQAECNYLCFTYDPYIAKDLGTAFTDELLTSFTPKNEVFYTFQWSKEKNDFVFDKEQTVAKLIEFANSELPLRILGFPAHLYFLINEYDLNLTLPSDSWLLTGGGWKGAENEKIDRAEFKDFISKRLGIIKNNQRDLFGMVEHGIAYLEDETSRFRIPNYSRILIRDPYSLKVLPPGEVGLIQFICTYNFSYPAMSVLSTDWGKVISDQGHDYLEIIGRAGVKKHKGCALSANRLMK